MRLLELFDKMIILAQAMPEGRVFGLDTQTLFSILIQLFNGILLAVVLGAIFYKPIKNFMQNRTNKIQGRIDESDAAMSKAGQLIEDYDAKIKDIENERVRILENARLKSIDEGKAILDQAKQEANEIRKRSLETVSADKKRLQEEARLYIIEIASLISEKYIAQSIDSKNHDKIFDEALAQLEESKWQI